MARTRRGPEQIIRKLRKAEVERAEGAKMTAVCKKRILGLRVISPIAH